MSKPSRGEFSIYEILRGLVENRKELARFIAVLLVGGVIAIGLINLFFNLAEMIGSEKLVRIDDRIMFMFIDARNDTLTTWMRAVTNLGSAAAYFILIPVSALILFLNGKKLNLVIEASLILISSSLLNTGLKKFYSRPRPLRDLHLVDVDSFSYPSGHAMSAMVFYGFLAYLSLKVIKNPWLKWLAFTINLVLIAGIGISRTYLGVHYPSDVLAGWAGGLFCLLICVLILRLFQFVKTKKQDFK